MAGNKDQEREKETWDTSMIGWQHRKEIIGARDKAVKLLEVVYSYIYLHIQVSTIGCERNFITFIDQPSSQIVIKLQKSKSEALEALEAYKVRAEKEAGRETIAFRTQGRGVDQHPIQSIYFELENHSQYEPTIFSQQ